MPSLKLFLEKSNCTLYQVNQHEIKQVLSILKFEYLRYVQHDMAYSLLFPHLPTQGSCLFSFKFSLVDYSLTFISMIAIEEYFNMHSCVHIINYLNFSSLAKVAKVTPERS